MSEPDAPADELARRRGVELGALLRARRALLRPEDVGLPERKRRHVRGLRREEVAQLADVGVSWYTLLEQGRIDRPNAKSLRRVTAALQLSSMESEHAFALALVRDGERRDPELPIEALHAFVIDYGDGAAFVTDANSQVVSWNALANELFVFASHPQNERSMLALMVDDERMRSVFANWRETLERMIGVFRATYAAKGNPQLDALVRTLRNQSSTFDALWRSYTVDALTAHVCVLRHQQRGELHMHFIALAPVDHPAYTIVILRERSNAEATPFTAR